VAVVLALVFGLLGHFSETTVHVAGRTYQIDMYGLPHRVEPPASTTQP
jgi:hypothetical protein